MMVVEDILDATGAVEMRIRSWRDGGGSLAFEALDPVTGLSMGRSFDRDALLAAVRRRRRD